MTSRRLEPFDKQSFQLGLILHLSKAERFRLECGRVDRGGDMWALGKRVNVGDVLRDHVIRCVCDQQMIYYLCVRKQKSIFLFSIDNLDEFSCDRKERAALYGFFMK